MKRNYLSRAATAAPWCVFLLLQPGAELSAQVFTGTVVDGQRGSPVSNATVRSIGRDSLSGGATTTDSTGFFTLRVQVGGEYRLEVGGFGYGPVVSNPYDVMPGDTVQMYVELPPQALELPGMIAALDRSRGGRDRFAARMMTEDGVFVTPSDLAMKEMRHAGDAFSGLRDEGVRLQWGYGNTELGNSPRGTYPIIKVASGTGCLRFMLNELPVFQEHPGTGNRNQWTYYPLNTIRPEDIVAIEIYRDLSETPREFRNKAFLPVSVAEADENWAYEKPAGSARTILGGRSVEEVTCGVVVIWTKERW